MCGGCSREGTPDWLSPAVPIRASREVAARTVSHLVAPTRMSVRADAAGFSVLRPTGRVTVAPNLTTVWDEVIASGAHLELSEPVPAGAAPAMHPHVPATELVLLLGSGPERVASAWAPDVLVDLVHDSLDGALAAGAGPRVLAWALPGAAESALAAVTSPGVRLRGTLVAVLREGPGPAWACELAASPDGPALRSILAGRPAASLHRPRLSVPAAAAWVGGLVATGRTAGRRLTLHVADESVTIDAADGTGLAVRPSGLTATHSL